MGVKDYDLNPDNNTQINGINIAEGCPPSGINNAIRQIMADVKADSDAQNKKASTPASGSNLGPVKVGSGLSADKNGVLTVAVDGKTTKVANGKLIAMDIALGGDSADPATGRGYLAKDKVPWYGGNTDAIDDFNALTLPGYYHISFSSTTQNSPDGVIYNSSGVNDGYIEIFKISSASHLSSYSRLCQRLTVFGGNGFTTVRRQQPSSTGAWYPWQRLIDSTDFAKATTPGIVKPGTGMTVDGAGALKVSFNNTVTSTSTTQAATANAVKTAYDKANAALPKANTSTTAASGKVPVANSSGKLDNSWLPTSVAAKAYITQTWKSSDGLSWYRKWSDGWIEQGGYHENTTTLDTVTLNTPFTNANYTLIVSDYNSTNTAGGHATSPFGCVKTTTNFKISQVKAGYEAHWYACGF